MTPHRSGRVSLHLLSFKDTARTAHNCETEENSVSDQTCFHMTDAHGLLGDHHSCCASPDTARLVCNLDGLYSLDHAHICDLSDLCCIHCCRCAICCCPSPS